MNHEFLFRKVGFNREQKRGLARIWHMHMKRRQSQDAAFQAALDALAALPSASSLQPAMRLLRALQASPTNSGGSHTATHSTAAAPVECVHEEVLRQLQKGGGHSSPTAKSAAARCDSDNTYSTHVPLFTGPSRPLQRTCSGSGSACSSARQEVSFHPWRANKLLCTMSEVQRQQSWQPLQAQQPLDSHAGGSMQHAAPLQGSASISASGDCGRMFRQDALRMAGGGPLGKRKSAWGEPSEPGESYAPQRFACQRSQPPQPFSGLDVVGLTKVRCTKLQNDSFRKSVLAPNDTGAFVNV